MRTPKPAVIDNSQIGVVIIALLILYLHAMSRGGWRDD